MPEQVTKQVPNEKAARENEWVVKEIRAKAKVQPQLPHGSGCWTYWGGGNTSVRTVHKQEKEAELQAKCSHSAG